MADVYEMYIADTVKLDKGEVDGFDISELAYDIRHITSLAGQPGKLTFSLKKDPTGKLEIEMGDTVSFWVNGIPVFLGRVFSAKFKDGADYDITCYDQMRYLKNSDYYIVEDKNINEVFAEVCEKIGLKYKIVNKSITTDTNQKAKVEKAVFANKSYFDIFQYMINNANRYITELQQVEEDRSKDIIVGAKVNFNGDVLYWDKEMQIQSFKRSNFEFESGNAFDGDWIVVKTYQLGKVTNKGSESSVLKNSDYLGSVYIKLDGKEQVQGWCSATDLSIAPMKIIDSDYKFNFIRDNFGTLELNDIVTNYKNSWIVNGGVRHNVPMSEMAENGYLDSAFNEDDVKSAMDNLGMYMSPEDTFVIGNGSLMTGFTFNISIDRDVYNEIWVMNSVTNKNDKSVNAVLKYAYDGTESENLNREKNAERKDRYGTLRLIINSGIKEDKSTEEAETLMKSIAKLNYSLFSTPTRTLKIDALGIVGLNAGDSFWLRINEINVNYLVYIISATHVYGDVHTMQLEVSTSKKLGEVLKSSYGS